jgi:hypothetical protein
MFDPGGSTIDGVINPGGGADEERERDTALARSREGMARALADPETRARIEARLTELGSRPPTPTMTGDEFLASVGFASPPASAG